MTQSNFFEELSILRTSNELNNGLLKNKNRVPNTSDPFLLLVNLLKVLVGESGIERGINSILKDLKKYQSNFKEYVKHECLDVLGGSKNKQITNSTFTINILKLSPNRLLMTKDKAKQSSLTTFEKNINNAILSKEGVGTINKHMDVKYNKSNGDLTFIFKYSNKPHIDLIYELIDEISIVELSNIYYDVLDSLFNFNNRSSKELEDEAKIDLIFNNFTTKDDIDDSYYKFTDDDIQYIEETIKVKNVYFYGEPRIDGSITPEEYNDFYKKNKDITSNNFLLNLSELVTKNVFLTDRSTAKKNFLERFLLAFKNVILKKYLLSSEIILIYNILYKSNDDKLTFIKKNKNFIKCIEKQLLNLILLTLFNIVKKEILKLVEGMVKTYSKDVLIKYRNILSSLI